MLAGKVLCPEAYEYHQAHKLYETEHWSNFGDRTTGLQDESLKRRRATCSCGRKEEKDQSEQHRSAGRFGLFRWHETVKNEERVPHDDDSDDEAPAERNAFPFWNCTQLSARVKTERADLL